MPCVVAMRRCAMQCDVVQWVCHVMWHSVVLCSAVPCAVVLCGAASCTVVQCHVMWCSGGTMCCGTVWCCVMQCHVLCCSVAVSQTWSSGQRGLVLEGDGDGVALIQRHTVMGKQARHQLGCPPHRQMHLLLKRSYHPGNTHTGYTAPCQTL